MTEGTEAAREEGRIVVVPYCRLLALLPIAYCLLPVVCGLLAWLSLSIKTAML